MKRAFSRLPGLSLLTLLLFSSSSVDAQSNESVYTSLEARNCRSLRTSSADYEGRCPGVAGYSLLVTEGDLRQNVTVITPGGRKQSLDLWTIISGGFSHVGPRAEWRMSRQRGKLRPVALIVRFNASEDPANPDKLSSYLAVAKITDDAICVTARISPGATANQDARRAADQAGKQPCLSAKN